jgi:GxxExxY protein
LKTRNLDYLRQVSLPVKYKGELLDAEDKIDILIEIELIIELKAV